MTKSSAQQDESPAQLIEARIEELGDWRGETLSSLRALIKQADPDVVEERKWRKATNPRVPVRGRKGDGLPRGGHHSVGSRSGG